MLAQALRQRSPLEQFDQEKQERDRKHQLELAIYDRMGPEAFKKHVGMGTLDERGALLEQQLKQAQALRQPQGKEYSTVAGNLLGGMGDIFRGVAGGMKESQLQERQLALLGQKDEGRLKYDQTYMEELRKLLQGPPQQPGQVLGSAGMGDLFSGDGFGFG